MTDPFGSQDDAATPLNPEEREGLLLSYVSTRGELNEAEQANILEAEQWATCPPRRRPSGDFARKSTIHVGRRKPR